MITSAANPRLKLIRKLESRRQRDKLGLFVCEGEDLVDAAARRRDRAGRPARRRRGRRAGAARRGLDDGAPAARDRRLPARRPAAVRAAAGLARALARLRPRERRDADPHRRRLRRRVGLSEGCGDPTGPKALRASAGAIFRVRSGGSTSRRGGAWRSSPSGPALAELELAGGHACSCSAPSGRGCRRTSSRPATPSRRSRSPRVAESLNVAVAGAIALYEWSRT